MMLVAICKVELYTGNDIKGSYAYFLSFNEMKNFVDIVPGYFDNGKFSTTQDLLTETIRAIEEKYE